MDPLELLRRAVTLHQTGRSLEAEAAYRSVLSVAPDFADALNLLGASRATVGRSDRAVDLFAAAVRCRPDVASFRANYAKALGALGRSRSATRQLRLATALRPDGDDGADAAFSLGNLLRRTGRAGEAARCFRRAAALRPASVDTRNNLAAALDADDRRDEAIVQLRLALALAPDDARTWFNLARSEQAASSPGSGVVAYRRAARTGAEFETTGANLAHALMSAGRADEVPPILRRINASSPADENHLPHLASALRAVGAIDESLALYRRWATLCPNDPTPRQRLVEVNEAVDRLETAAAVLAETAVLGRRGRFHPKTAYYHLVRLCNALIAAGRRERVAPILDHAERAFRPVDAEWRAWTVFLRGSLDAAEGRVGEARRRFVEAGPHLPFLVHVCLDDDFARAIAEPESAATRAVDDAVLIERRVDPGTGPVVFAACDARYLRRFGPLFATTADRFAPAGATIHFHVVDPDADTPAVIAALSAALPRSRLGWSREALPPGLVGDGRVAYLTCARFIRLNRIIAEYRAPVVVADIDACVLGDPAAFTEALSLERPLALQYFPLNLARLYDGVGGGLVVLRPDPGVVALFDRIRRFLVGWAAAGDMRYFLDQIALVAGLDDAARGNIAPDVIGVETRGRLFRLGEGSFVQILDEKAAPDFDRRVEKLLRELEEAGPPVDPAFERSRILAGLGIPE